MLSTSSSLRALLPLGFAILECAGCSSSSAGEVHVDAGGGGESGTGGIVSTLASGLANPVMLTLDATNLYLFTQPISGGQNGAIIKIPLAGGSPTTLVSNVAPAGMAVGSSDVYWSEADGSAHKVPISGGAASTVVPAGDSTGDTSGYNSAAISATDFYWLYGADATILKVPLGGGSVTTIYKDTSSEFSSFDDLALSSTDVYWTEPGGVVMSVPIAGGSATTLYSGDGNPESVAVDATSVYWADTKNETIMKVAIGGGTPTTLAKGTPDNPETSAVLDPAALAIDSKNVYWVNGGNATLVAVPLAGGAPTTLANPSQSTSVVVNGTSAYFNAIGGAIEKLSPK